MKYILMMSSTKADWDWYAKWPKKDLQANIASMKAFSKELRESGELVSTEGLAWPDQAKLVRAGKDGARGSMPIEVREVMSGHPKDLL
jgi:hypothetical protein